MDKFDAKNHSVLEKLKEEGKIVITEDGRIFENKDSSGKPSCHLKS